MVNGPKLFYFLPKWVSHSIKSTLTLHLHLNEACIWWPCQFNALQLNKNTINGTRHKTIKKTSSFILQHVCLFGCFPKVSLCWALRATELLGFWLMSQTVEKREKHFHVYKVLWVISSHVHEEKTVMESHKIQMWPDVIETSIWASLPCTQSLC